MEQRYKGHPTDMDGMEEAERETFLFLDAHGIEYDCLTHEAAYTMEECAVVERKLGAPICKNLFLCNRQQTQFYLLMLPGNKVFKTKFLTKELGCSRLSFADESHMTDLLGLHPGAVSPMGLIHDKERKVMLVIDRDLFSTEYFGCHPCVNTATVRLSFKDLMDKFVPATHHECRIIDLQTE